jgi:hypothetical protein
MNNIGQPAQPNRELVKCAIAEVSGIAGLTVRSMSEKRFIANGSESCLATMYDFLVAGVRVTGYEARTGIGQQQRSRHVRRMSSCTESLSMNSKP